MNSVELSPSGLRLDGRPFRIFAGAIHYFRVHPELWRDRLQKLQACGFNTVETYIAWNLHEPRPEHYEFSGFTDIVQFLQIAQELGLKAIVRPGPYICSEWEFGALPAWLLNLPGLRLRCHNDVYLAAVKKWFDVLLPKLRPLLHTQGGPIIALQVENEYGSYGNDKEYLGALRQMYLDHGLDQIVLFTSDGGCDYMLQGGMLPGLWETVNFGSRARQEFGQLKKYQPDLPLMNTEFWNGWFDHWMEPHHTNDAVMAAAALRETLETGANICAYMFHGGTNFGFMNGANQPSGKEYQPTVTSYDDDAPLNECGDPTPKFVALREVIAEFNPSFKQAEHPIPEPGRKIGYGRVKLTQTANLLEMLPELGKIHRRATPDSMETFGQNYGFILYRHHLRGPLNQIKLTVQEPRDRAQVFLDRKPIATFYRNDPTLDVIIDVPPEGAELEILVENLGRVNYGPYLEDGRKGISVGVRIENQFLFGWDIVPLPLNDLSGLHYSHEKIPERIPAFYRGELEIQDPADTFLKVPGGDKGIVWLNGFNLGRYWQVGPQHTLYVPAPLLKKGKNVVEVLELSRLGLPEVHLLDHPEL